MFLRRKGEQPVSGAEPIGESPEEVDRQATAAAHAETAARERIDQIDDALKASVDVGERARLREERVQVEAIRDDARELHATLIARRDRLAQGRMLAKLEPDRQAIADREAKEAALAQQLAALRSDLAERKLRLEEAEDEILRPTLSSGEEQELRWLIQQWRSGSPVGAHLGRMSRRVQKAAQARMQAIAGSVPDAVADHRLRARQSFEDAGIPHWEPLAPIEVPEVEIPEPTPSNSLPYPRIG